MKQFILLFILAAALFDSCKKKEETTTTSSTVVGTTGTTGAPPSATTAAFNGLCSSQKMYFIAGSSASAGTYAQNLALFSTSVFNNFAFPTTVLQNAGTLKLNDVAFTSSSGYYTDPSGTTKAGPFVWSCDGADVAAFTFTNSNSYATYSDYVYWPDTIKKSEGFFISFAGLQKASEAEIVIINYGSSSAITCSAATGAGNYSVAPSRLSSLLTSTAALLQCNFFTNNVQNIGGKLINFRNVTSYVKSNVQVKN
jgi:hypothetical protein